jgi:hypothetical protein
MKGLWLIYAAVTIKTKTEVMSTPSENVSPTIIHSGMNEIMTKEARTSAPTTVAAIRNALMPTTILPLRC